MLPNNHRKVALVLRRIVITLLFILVVPTVGLIIIASVWQAPNEVETPSGLKRNASFYVQAADGTPLAIDVWLPADLNADQRIPAVVEGTRYWRANGLTAFGRVAAMFGAPLPGLTPGAVPEYFNAKGYAMVTVDVRGTGASFGVHQTEYSPQEIADYAAVFDWIVAQPWSSGDVFATGVSYGGTSAELMTTTAQPALKAVAPLYSDFDAQYHLATPGGVMQPAFVDTWSDMVAAMDRNDLCAVMSASSGRELGFSDCFVPELLVSGVKPVAGQWSALREAVAQHNSPNVAEMVQSLEFRDSPWGISEVVSAESQVYGRKAEIEASRVPMFIITGWLDAATSDGALARFASFSNPQEVWIGPFDHGGSNDVDPFKPAEAPPIWNHKQQLDRVEAFFRSQIEGRPTTSSTLNYFVMGSDQWRNTETWPPEHLAEQFFYFGSEGQLSDEMPTQTRFDDYEVDFASGTSADTRWITQMGGRDVRYDNSSAHGLSYTSAPLEEDYELTGTPVLDLWMTSTAADGAMHSYLEAISPSDEVIYLTEGVLRLIHRSNTSNPPYPTFAPSHSFLEADASPMPTGQVQRITTALYATSAKIPRGYRLRIRLTGADATSFAPLPASAMHGSAPPRWHVYRGPTKPSSITLPLAVWSDAPGAANDVD